MSSVLTSTDLIVIVVYLAAMTLVGTLFYDRDADTKDFFLASRSVSWIPLGICIVATDFSAVSYLGSPAFVFQRDLQALPMNFVQVLVVLLLVVPLIIPFYNRLQVFTSYEFLERRFDSRVRTTAGCLFLLLRSLYLGVVLYAPSLAISAVTGLPLTQSILFMGVLTTIYSAAGGMRAVIWTDLLQFATIIIGMAALAYSAASGIEGDWASIWQKASALNKTRLLDFSLDPTKEYTAWALLLGGSVIFLNTFGADQIIVQRYMTAKSLKECQNAMRLKAAVSLTMALCLASIGLLFSVYYSQHPEELQGLARRDAILPHFAVRHLGAGLPGLVIASLFAAAMSTLSGGLNSLATVTVIDFYRRLWRKSEEELHYVRVSRMATLGWGAIATVAALFAERLGELFVAYAKVNSYLGGVILAIFLLGMLTRRVDGSATLAGAAVGFAAVLAVSLGTPVSWLWYGFIGCFTTFLAALLFSYRPTSAGATQS